ncbi:hypothetical protein C0995_005977 [Termitomyces sp. Mi166|nr:hypothetical protein C0995_005977 [Termitomyces sp. Mi166\
MTLAEFPIDLSKFDTKLALDPSKPKLSAEEKKALEANIQLFRDAIVLFTATGAARGVSGHTGIPSAFFTTFNLTSHQGGAYDTAPEVCILLALFNHSKNFYPVVFDEAGHRVATQYLLAALEGSIPAAQLLHYREANSKLPGHPELGLTPGVKFSSGRLGHMWPLVNGIALANRDKTVFCLGSDGSQQEGNDAEAARLAVAQNLNVKLLIDDNDVTIAGHPSQYLKGYNVARTLEGHGLTVFSADGEDIDRVWEGITKVVGCSGPAARLTKPPVVLKRKMAPGIPNIEGSTHGHDVIPVKAALAYFQQRGGFPDFSSLYASAKAVSQPYTHLGSTKDLGATRVIFGEAVNLVLDALSPDEAKKRVMVIDSDLEGSTGLKVIHQKHPEVFVPSGIMERGNFSAAAGFGFEEGKTGVFSTFSAFLEMVMADNTCHFGINSFFADNGLPDTHTALYFPADGQQMIAIIRKVFFDPGLRFVFSTRSKVPWLLREDGSRFFDDKYEFHPGKDEVLQEGKDGYVVAVGEMVYRAWDAVLRVRKEGMDVGLVNKPCLNMVDEETMMKIGQSPFVLVVESFNQKTGVSLIPHAYTPLLTSTQLGSKFGTWLLERRLTPKYGYIGSTREGSLSSFFPLF